MKEFCSNKTLVFKTDSSLIACNCFLSKCHVNSREIVMIVQSYNVLLASLNIYYYEYSLNCYVIDLT